MDKCPAETRRCAGDAPRFRTTREFQLNNALAGLGMSTAFNPDLADFSGMNGNRELFISAVLHKAFVDVNEEGTEAAAATGVVVGVRSAPADEPPVFRADHPFLFLIRDTRSGVILFLGRVVNPLE
ncbi:MAG: serpin family protein [Planctomycetaceae bacterium]